MMIIYYIITIHIYTYIYSIPSQSSPLTTYLERVLEAVVGVADFGAHDGGRGPDCGLDHPGALHAAGDDFQACMHACVVGFFFGGGGVSGGVGD